MSGASARDLLRRAREQKKQATSATNTRTTQPTALSSDVNAHIDAKGKLYCRICNVQVKPSDANSWKIHVASRRHQQSSKPAAAAAAAATGTTTKRLLESDNVSDISKLSIKSEAEDSNNTVKRQKIVDDGMIAAAAAAAEQETAALLVGYESDSEESEKPEDIPEPPEDEISGLPEAIGREFDDSSVLQPNTTAASDDDSDGLQEQQQQNLPSGFFDNPDEQVAAETGGAMTQQAQAMQLDERLAEFESDIAELSTEPNTAVPNTAVPIGDEDYAADFLSSINEEVELEQQSEMWRQRTDKLLHLRSIIKEGIRDMDLSERNPLQSSDVVMKGSDSSDSEEEEEEEDFSELMNWKSSSI